MNILYRFIVLVSIYLVIGGVVAKLACSCKLKNSDEEVFNPEDSSFGILVWPILLIILICDTDVQTRYFKSFTNAITYPVRVIFRLNKNHEKLNEHSSDTFSRVPEKD